MSRPLFVCVVLLLSCVSSVARAQEPPPVAPVASESPPFDDWLATVREEAASRGIRSEILDLALTGIQPVPQILDRDRGQAEFTLDLDVYLKRRLTPTTVRTARRMYARYATLLRRIGAAYDVDPRLVIAVWGLESNFGRFAGVRPTIPTLVTLAYDQRRSALFRAELMHALEILNRGDIDLPNLKGSWAGALGQPQFMPSSYLEYAQDFDKDGRRNIWTSLPDVFASVAYYLQRHGWSVGQRWGREVRVSAAIRDDLLAIPRRTEGCRAERLLTEPRPLDDWRRLGIRTATGGPLPRAKITASLLQAGSRSYLVYGNYAALLGYNCAHSYAISVATLADRLR